jgi:hypothetical protein
MELVHMRAFTDELGKIAGVSTPAITAPPVPGGLLGGQNPAQAAPITPRRVVQKALQGTTLQKTNYTTVHTGTPRPTSALTQEQETVSPPGVGI